MHALARGASWRPLAALLGAAAVGGAATGALVFSGPQGVAAGTAGIEPPMPVVHLGSATKAPLTWRPTERATPKADATPTTAAPSVTATAKPPRATPSAPAAPTEGPSAAPTPPPSSPAPTPDGSGAPTAIAPGG